MKKTTVISFLCVLLTAFLTVFFAPREGKFRYQFYEGKPWQYGLLTAPHDFPVYKEASEIEAAKDSIRKKFEPYFRFNDDEERVRLEEWSLHKSMLSERGVPATTLDYIDRSLTTVYRAGIASAADLGNMKKGNRQRINVLTNSMSEVRNLSAIHSVKTAYQTIIDKAPSAVKKDRLSECNVNEFLAENLMYDAETSAKVLDDRLQQLPLSNGMVQAGERIVDRGEVIDGHIYSILRSLKTVYETKSGGSQRHNVIFIGQFILIFAVMICFGFYLKTFYRKIFYHYKDLAFILLCLLSTCLLSEICVKYSLLNIYILPFAIVPIVIRTFFDSHTALFTHLVTTVICSLTALFPYEFLLLQFMAGVVVVISLKDLSQRSQLFGCSLLVAVTYAVVYLSLALFQESSFVKINWDMMLYFGINFILLMFSYVLIYILEKIFGYISPITLVELSNINAPLLKRLSEEAPGTFQHSLQVSILASEAAQKVGANSQLIRTGALYHDIGKLYHPVYFTENKQSGMENPHDKLSYKESSQKVIAHVAEGVKLAEKAGLPKDIIEFIPTHHGNGYTKAFYNAFRNEFPDVPVSTDEFSYPGPNPATKETALLMMADSVEAASRSLPEYTDVSIKGRIDKIIDGQISDGLLNKAPLTFNDIAVIKGVFLERLKTIYHTRISYPELK
ncbi:MAG: HDIG domain-containing protein [Tannerella sp.]|jgi:putative nucleotidyltransferase with HDIG domain|nr:HDIG domain-containing protein [Tannerella sp.]